MPRTRVFTLKPYWPVDGSFIDPPGDGPSFDPAHPTYYPGLEVECIATLTAQEFTATYRNSPEAEDIMYSVVHPQGLRGRAMVAIWRLTGRTSADVIAEAR